MQYKLIEVDPDLPMYVSIKLGEKKYTTFPASNDSPAYISFLRQLSEENPNDPHYTEWVEAGNNPEEFWTQSEVN